MLLFEEQKVTNPPKAGGYAKILCVSPQPPPKADGAYGGIGNWRLSVDFILYCSNSPFALASRRLDLSPVPISRYGEMTVRATLNYIILIILSEFHFPRAFWPDKKYIIYS